MCGEGGEDPENGGACQNQSSDEAEIFLRQQWKACEL